MSRAIMAGLAIAHVPSFLAVEVLLMAGSDIAIPVA